jgi:hypothetical protein
MLKQYTSGVRTARDSGKRRGRPQLMGRNGARSLAAPSQKHRGKKVGTHRPAIRTPPMRAVITGAKRRARVKQKNGLNSGLNVQMRSGATNGQSCLKRVSDGANRGATRRPIMGARAGTNDGLATPMESQRS